MKENKATKVELCREVKKQYITLNIGLCEGRHSIPEVTDGYIYPSEVNPTDLRELNSIAVDSLMNLCEREYNKAKEIVEYSHRLDFKLNLYVTGLTVALIEVLNVCKMYDIQVTLYHYDRETGTYYPQNVI